jgi:hypothetical protein
MMSKNDEKKVSEKNKHFSARRVDGKREEKKGPGRELNPGPPPDDWKP